MSGVEGLVGRLLPCPFCGGPANGHELHHGHPAFVHCEACLMEGPFRETAEEAVEAWNTRAQPVALAAAPASGARAEGPGLERERNLVASIISAINAMDSVTVFVTSKERIKRPEGEDWWRDEIMDLRQVLDGDVLAATGPERGGE